VYLDQGKVFPEDPFEQLRCVLASAECLCSWVRAHPGVPSVGVVVASK